MNARRPHLIAEAEARLRPDGQERLADIVQAFVANREADNNFTPEEMALLREIDAEPFRAANPDEAGEAVIRGACLRSASARLSSKRGREQKHEVACSAALSAAALRALRSVEC